MKKLILMLTAVMLSSVVFAQSKAAQTAPAAKPSYVHYAYVAGKLMNCLGETAEMQTTDVKLENGNTITTKGEVILADGKSRQMIDGECADQNGRIMNHEKMHRVMEIRKAQEGK